LLSDVFEIAHSPSPVGVVHRCCRRGGSSRHFTNAVLRYISIPAHTP
jgi:hypothetical protein